MHHIRPKAPAVAIGPVMVARASAASERASGNASSNAMRMPTLLQGNGTRERHRIDNGPLNGQGLMS
ncbi:MAG TPA: hypothetical protein VJR95_00650 [Rhodanobacter sp.]|nr:hypothetical protein [Rhodanobacter sp.]